MCKSALTPTTTLKELKALAAEMGETLHKARVAWVSSPVKALWDIGREKATVEESSLYLD